MIIHKDLTPERWFSFSIFKQLANVGMDVTRTIDWKKKDNLEYSTNALYRALELLDLTIADPKNRGCRRRELLRVREALVDFIMYDNEYQTTETFWHDYFYNFNYAAALERGL